MDLAKLQPESYFEQMIDKNNLIGTGTTREVYGAVNRDDVVIKVLKKEHYRSNVIEWIVWTALLEMGNDIFGNVSNPSLKGLFAECFATSHSSRYLMMERLTPLPPGSRLETKDYPIWLNDRKPNAFGLAANGEVKVMDYALVNFYHVLNPKNWTPAPSVY